MRSYGDPSTDFRAKFPLFYMFGNRVWNELHPEPWLRLLEVKAGSALLLGKKDWAQSSRLNSHVQDAWMHSTFLLKRAWSWVTKLLRNA